MGSTFTLRADFKQLDGGATLTKSVSISSNEQVLGDAGRIFDAASVDLVDGALAVELPDNTNAPYEFGYTVRRATGMTKTWRVPVQAPGATVELADFTSLTPLPMADNDLQVARAELSAETTRAEAAEALLAPKASPVLTGNPTAPTQSPGTNSTRIATTAYADAAVALEAGARALAITSAVTTAVNNLLAGTPGALDTLKELADALGDDPNFATTITNLIAAKVPQTRTLAGLDLSANRSAQDLVTALGTALSASIAAMALLTNVSVSADGALARQKLTKVDASGGVRAMTIPDGTQVGEPLAVEKVDSSANLVNVAGKIRSTGSTTLPLTYQYETIELVWGGTFWEPLAGHRTKSSIDAQITTTGDARYNHGQAATQVVMRKLAHGESARVAILTDSTDDASNEWGYLLGQTLAASWPAETVKWTPPADDAYTPGTTLTIQTGSGTGTLFISNMGIAGSQSYNWQSADFLAQIQTFAPDLILVSSGHNDDQFTGDPATLGQPQEAFRLRYQVMLEELRRLLPRTQFVLVAQHQWLDGTGDMDLKRDELRHLASLGGHGFYDMYQAWHDAGAPSGWYLDNVHINSTGEAFYAAQLAGLFVYDTKWEPRPVRPSLLDLATPLNLADDMVMPSGASGPVGWNLVNATVTRDTTNFESSRGYAIRVQRTAGAAAARIYKQILDSSQIVPLRGQWVLVLVRMRRPAAGSVPGNRYVGRISVSDGVANSKTFADDKGYGGFMWRAIPHKVDAAATSLVVSLWSDWSSAGDALNPDVTWDRFMVIPGLTPYGWAGRSGVGALRNSDKVETLTVGDSAMATQPTLILDAALNVVRQIAVKTAGVNRWLFSFQTSETGTEAGSDLVVGSRKDDGTSNIAAVLTLNRKRGSVAFGAWQLLAKYATASRPNATTSAAEGALAWDSDLHRPIFDDGTIWQPGLLGLSATASLTFPSITAGSQQEQTITVTGAVVGDAVSVGPPAALEAGLQATGYVSAANTVKIRLSNVTGSTISPAVATWKAAVVR